MRRRAWLLPALAFLASPLWAQPVPPPALDAATNILSYLPPDADLAVLVRMDALARTDLWRCFRQPQDGIYHEIVKEFDLAIDFEKDVSAGVFCLRIIYEENGDPGDAAMGMALALNRDVQPQTLFKNVGDSQPVEFPGVSIPVYRIAPEILVALPASRTVVIAMPAYLAPMLTAATTLYRTQPWPRRELAVPGEITFAGRMPEKLKAAIRTAFEKERRRYLKQKTYPGPVLEFVLLYNLVALAVDADSAAGSVNLADPEAALRATFAFGEGRLAPAAAAVAQAMADPLAIALPALFGGAPLDKPPDPGAPGLYLIRADDKAIRLTMSRANLEQLVAQMSAGAMGEKERVRSANNLRQIGLAVQAFLADQGAYPTSLSALFPKYLADLRILENPARAAHLPDGDYCLVPLTKESAAKQPWAKVLAYEILSRGEVSQEGLNVLFADGHVEYVTVEAFQRLCQETLKDLGR
jgi:prepilin-type processing-associated H-X9-DG protein